MVVAAAVITTLYSLPPFRTKRLGIWGQRTIAVPEACCSRCLAGRR